MIRSAVVLAAGEGLRAWPYCGIRQKVTVPVLNVPMVRRLALDLIALGVENTVVVIGHRGEAVRACLADLASVRFVEQSRPAGTVGAALAGLSAIRAEEALVCCGDIVTTRDSLRAVLEAFDARRVEAVLLTADRPEGLTASWATVDVAPDGSVRGLWARGGTEHPRFAGVAAARVEPLRRCLLRDPGIAENVHVGAMPPLEGEWSFAFERMRQDGAEVHAVAAQGFFVDVDKPWHIVEANHKAAQHAFNSLDEVVVGEGASIDEGADIAPNAKLWLGPGARIGKGCHVLGSAILGESARVTTGAIIESDVIIGARTRCEEYCKIGSGSVLGPDNVASHCAEFDGVTFDMVYLYHYSCVTALIGSHVDIGAATVCGTWRFDDGVKTQSVRGHNETPECFGSYTYIGDYARTGVNATFMPGVKVGYYSCVGAGAIVYDDVPERTLLLAKQEHVLKPWGPEQYGW